MAPALSAPPPRAPSRKPAPRWRCSISTPNAAHEKAAAIGGGALALACDVTDPASVAAAYAQVVAAFGGVDILVSNAGAAWQGRIGEVDEAMLRKSFELNFFAHQKMAQGAVKIMLSQGTGGCLLFNVSKQAVNPGPNFGPYGLPKAATLFLVRQYALDYGADGIRANAVNADRIRSGLLTADFIKERAKARGLSEKDYMSGNLLRPRGHRRRRGASVPGAGAGAQDHGRRYHRRRRQYRRRLALAMKSAKTMLSSRPTRNCKGAPTMLRNLALIALVPLLLVGKPGARRHRQGEAGNLQGRRRQPRISPAPRPRPSSRSAWPRAITSRPRARKP